MPIIRPSKKPAGFVRPTSSTRSPQVSSKVVSSVPEPLVELRTTYIAPSRTYMQIALVGSERTFVLERAKCEKQHVVVLQRTLFKGAWVLLLLVGPEIKWEFEIDVKLWERVYER